MNGRSIVLQEEKYVFFKNQRKEVELDEGTFSMWKSELQNNLPQFWEAMNK